MAEVRGIMSVQRAYCSHSLPPSVSLIFTRRLALLFTFFVKHWNNVMISKQCDVEYPIDGNQVNHKR